MQKYLGVKLIKATPSLEGVAYKPREGYTVEYKDGYVSWSPKETFEEAYRRIDNLTFGFAIEALKKGYKVARQGWNGKGMWLVLMPALYLPPYNTADTYRKVNDRTAKYIGADKPLDSQPYIAMWTAQEKWQPGWFASQADMLAEDWVIIE